MRDNPGPSFDLTENIMARFRQIAPVSIIVAAGIALGAGEARAQAASQDTIDPQIHSNGGDHQAGAFGELYSTIGEPFAADSVSFGTGDDEATWTGFWNVVPSDDSVTDVREEWAPIGSGENRIASASPNPFPNELQLYVRLERRCVVRLSVYDPLGREVALLAEGTREEGMSRYFWRPQNLAPGSYVVRLLVDGRICSTQTVQRMR